MNKKLNIIHLFIIVFGLFSGYNNCSMQPQQPQSTQQSQPFSSGKNPLNVKYPSPASSAPLSGERKRIQPRAATTESYQAPEITTETSQVEPYLLDMIAKDLVKLWNIYNKAKRTQNDDFNGKTISELNAIVEHMEQMIDHSDNDQLKEAYNAFNNLLESSELYDKSIFGQALNVILEAINNIIDFNPDNPYKRHYSLADIPYFLSVKEVPTLYNIQRTVLSPFSTAWDWTKGTIGGALATGWDYGKWGVKSIGSGLGATREWVAPTQEEVDKATMELPKIKKEIDRLQSKKNPTKDDQTSLTNLKSIKSWYESIIRGWKPTFARAATLGLGAGYLYFKSK